MTAADHIRFESPAPHLPLPSAEMRDAFIAALRTRPGEWALIGQNRSPGAARQAAYALRNSLSPWTYLPGSLFETDCKTVIGEHRVYVRYMGDAAEAATSEVPPA
ncbi:hypothetical protein [Streptomyces cylindrosporus]|uniref:Uncharacterized protein n=1 Tax=Streptomyces cylindrosporus TaxID=2927583 RepID=A0ABS9YLP5_9ACTN|nr:hypothetical protein [Streptomyces cylindrosporus]MCI3277465.1 hypothetical protein [Streptomyces cylindrosporus]